MQHFFQFQDLCLPTTNQNVDDLVADNNIYKWLVFIIRQIFYPNYVYDKRFHEILQENLILKDEEMVIRSNNYGSPRLPGGNVKLF